MRARWRCSSSRSSSRRRGLSSGCSTGGWSMADRAGGRGALGRRVSYMLALPLALVMIAPFLYMVAAALMSQPDALRRPALENVAAALVALPVGRFLLNSAMFSLAVVAGQVLTSATAAYAFARLRFPGRDRLFLAYLCALMAPGVLLAIPRFLLIDALGWVDSYQGLISNGAGVGHRDLSPASVLPHDPARPRGRGPTRGRGRVDHLLAGDRAAVPARPRHARRARVRRSVEELSLAARRHTLERDAAGRGGHREPGRHVPCELVVPDGECGSGPDPADGALFRGAEVLHTRYRADSGEVSRTGKNSRFCLSSLGSLI